MKQLVIFTALMLIFAALCSFMPTGEEAEIYDNVVRLHVIANSDSEHDQSVKLYVRDAVLEYIDAISSDAENAEAAASMIADSIYDIRAHVSSALAEIGEETAVTVSLTREYYPTREYDDVALPSGNYTSLRIMLGKAEGQNWWCVLYPSICTSSAKASSIFKKTGFSPEQINVLTDGEKPVYKIKFKILEILSDISS